ncbi:hypothetical protein BD780_000654 [Clostridium tetanomorphum]|uniref:Uncharacterized protein n=1 Tax=Clostridium tetanomorphum TaxID=1553 RepID=A0A923E9T6_CLOTT|nr:hypothetical protein [Clostridium tetanomorphum]KAJ48983.1 hypothetical protein CTM_25556 [Clostridium tetanomorphum DSM 665]KAJ51355.1 hypothetical protein CTM_12985 [Clostridium tetanomorphum DSM 665]MBC2396438.1 hypothetical protein [Clostridium tetanomorphum]MBP1863332.1 hypothetical protein [Clostridium tetanomorphum]NRS83429.1 hypothetical protein [Clostridium tetanomorphum]
MDKDVKVALLKEELEELKESFKYQFGDNYMDYPEVQARLEVIKNMITFYEEN